MSAIAGRARLTRMISICSTVLCLLIAIEYFYPPEYLSQRERKPVSVVPESTGLAQYQPPDFDAYGEILARPLFYRDRKLPPQPKAPVPEEVPLEPLELSLEGVAIASSSKVALLRNQNGNELIQLTEGMSHNGWILESVESTGAAFRRGADITELEIEASVRAPRRRLRR